MIERKTFTFDGENSADYGLYISGDSVYNAPNREIDMISIPGRNGQLAIDMGRYENITVTYPAFVIADTQAEFREKIRRIRNWLCSKTSYQRLTDDYNPESFRLGLYKSGLEVEPIFYNRCGEFKMSFDCQPQRFLFEGEEVFTLGEWGETETYSGSIASFEGTETTAVKSLKANITPIQSGSGDPSPSNVRPISGYSEVKTTRCGKNILKNTLTSTTQNGTTFTKNADGSVTISGTPSAKATVLLSGGDFLVQTLPTVFSYGVPMPTGTRLYCKATSTSGTVSYPTISSNSVPYVILSTSGATLNNLVIEINTSFNGTPFTIYPMIELGSTPTSYEPYNGTTYTTSLGQTVYGGTLDVVSGVLTIDKVLVDLGSLSWSYFTSPVPFFSANKTDIKANTSNYICSNYPSTTEHGTISNLPDKSTMIYNRDIRVRDSSYTTASDFKTAMNGVQLVYELATPTEITLTPTQVTTLLGNNNIWANSGDVTVEIGENPYILVNPTKFEACPIFEVEGAGSLSIGDTTLTISNTGTTIIDTEMMEAYEDDNGAIISRNDDVEGGFPTLTSGINNVEADGLTSVKVTPKWWEL